MSKKVKLSTFDKTMSLDEAQNEKAKDTSLGRSLREADSLDKRRRRGGV